MTYRVNVCEHPTWIKAFEKFADAVWFFMPETTNEFRIRGDINEALSDWHCKSITNTPFIEFRSEKDAIIFLLRWT